METVTPLRSFALFVTPEEDPATQAPKGERVLSTVVSK